MTATYAFLPWLRRGMACVIPRPDGPPADPGVPRASIDVALTFNDDASYAVQLPLALSGPGEIASLRPDAVFRTEPRPGVADVEPNYLPFVETEPDLPWRYTAARATSEERLTPWLALVCLTEAELAGYRAAGPDVSLPVITVRSGASLPPWSQLWAWAHVQVSGVDAADAATLGGILANDPERAVARILCPRRLEPQTAYRAFLVPTFERGRLAGLGEEVPETLDALAPAWSAQSADLEFPVYFEWKFQTGVAEDFESLVRKLVPRVLPPTVGRRDMRVDAPGAGLPPAAPGPLAVEGALRTAGTERTAWEEPSRGAFVAALRALLNLPTLLLRAGGRPAVAPPLYGRWHAALEELAPGGPAPWFQELNSDPRLRVAAGVGTEVVQAQQVHLMAGAWAQVKRIRELNAEARQLQLSRAGTGRLLERHLAAQPLEDAILTTAPIHGRVRGSARTLRALLRDAPVGTGILDPQWRRLSRPLGPLGRRQGGPRNRPERGVLTRLNAGELAASVVPPKPTGLFTHRDGREAIGPGLGNARDGARLERLARALRVAALVLAALALVLLAFARNLPAAAALAVAAAFFFAAGRLRARAEALRREDGFAGGTLASEDVRRAPRRPEFVAGEAPPATGPTDVAPPPSASPVGASDGASAAAFRSAAMAMLERFQEPPRERPALRRVDLGAMRGAILRALDPDRTIAASFRRRLAVAKGIVWEPGDPLQEVMAAPEFPQPMYEPLRDRGQDWLLPGLDQVPANTVALLETNPPFIEAYMVGLNHEMARELLWNEYPTDQRGTYFRQFWDVRGYVPPPGRSVDAEALKDIREIHRWERTARLGENGVRPGADGQLVLLVRGELLRRYPNTLLYAVRATQPGPDGKRGLGTEEKHPLFRGTLAPDLTFLGWDLTESEARGTAGDPGWFFVVQEQPAEPRFGLDLPAGYGGAPATWDELSWGHLAPDAAGLAALTHIDLAAARPDTQAAEDHPSNVPSAVWHVAAPGRRGVRASDIAYVTLARPVRIAIHASRMLAAAGSAP